MTGELPDGRTRCRDREQVGDAVLDSQVGLVPSYCSAVQDRLSTVTAQDAERAGISAGSWCNPDRGSKCDRGDKR
jgi:hypothetical protein